MKVVIAPDSFKESLSAQAVADAMAAGVRRAAPDAEIDLCPMADGGEGTVDAMVAATGGEIRTARVHGPLGRPREARFGLLGDDRTAVIEMAEAAGLSLVPRERRDPMRTTTFGVGNLIRAALDAGAARLVLGIGGSATVDGGCGCAQALGVVFLDKRGRPCVCGLAGGGLADIGGIDASDRDPRIAAADVRVACDVTNPLTGPDGAAAVYGPQKGATPEMVASLEAGLANLAAVIRRDLGVDVEHLPGAGASGGLGAGLVAFAGAELVRGVELIAAAVGLTARLGDADLCLTGEGRFDAQSAHGKTAYGVARVAAAAGVPALCIPGQATDDAPGEAFAAVHPLVNSETPLEQALARTAELLEQRTAEAVAVRLQPGGRVRR
jgi:glycerate kinase